MPSELRLRVPFALSHIGYEADGSKRTQTETCAAVFLSVSLGEGVLTVKLPFFRTPVLCA
jgi:hypothetical protein